MPGHRKAEEIMEYMASSRAESYLRAEYSMAHRELIA